MSAPFDHAEAYRAAGWRGTLALPPRAKASPETGFTGYVGGWPETPDIERWRLEGRENIAIRMPRGVIGLDGDAYGDKPGANTLADLAVKWGKLPPTWMSTSRSDGVSGIRWYRYSQREHPIPDDAWPTAAGPAVEIIRRAHRYAVAPPSLHPEGRVYRWVRPDGTVADEGEIPSPGDLALLPTTWLEGLTGISANGDRDPNHVRPGSRAEQREHHKHARAWIERLPGGDPCEYTAKLAADAYAAARREDGGSAYEDTRDAVLALLRAGEVGHYGVGGVLERTKPEYVSTVAEKRGGENIAKAEYDRFLLAGAAKVLKSPSDRAGDGCDCSPQQIRARPDATPTTLDSAHTKFQKWLGKEYDLDALDAVLCTLAAERLGGDPLWLLLVSGPGNAKTETVQAASGIGATIVSTISSEGALLSGSPKKSKSKDATGGLLVQIGAEGVLVVKDVTSILSMHRDTRAALLAAFREIHDGHWVRNVGTDGGRTLTWQGRLVVIGAVTTAWDRAYDVISSMGDRFVLVRMDSTRGRSMAGRRSMRNTGDETRMRKELEAVVAGVLATVERDSNPQLTDSEVNTIVAAADLVTLARTGVDYDYRGDVIDAHAPEMPTRFAKQLGQLMRGGIALGMSRGAALKLAIRCARDSMPPLRLAILLDVHAHPHTRASDVRRRLAKPWSTVDRQLQSLHMLGVLACDEEERGGGKSVWRYTVSAKIDPVVLNPSPELSPHALEHTEKESERAGESREIYPDTDISGDEYDRLEREAIQAEQDFLDNDEAA